MKHASHAAQQLSTVHWLQAVAGVLTGFLQSPVVGGLGVPAPMPLHWAMQLFVQHASMPLPRVTPLGCCVSQLEMQAAMGSPPLEPEEPLEEPEVPPEEPEDCPDVQLEPAPLVPPLAPELDEVEPPPVELLEQASASPATRQAATDDTT